MKSRKDPRKLRRRFIRSRERKKLAVNPFYPLSEETVKRTVIGGAFGGVGLVIHDLYPHAFDFMFRLPNPDAPETATREGAD